MKRKEELKDSFLFWFSNHDYHRKCLVK